MSFVAEMNIPSGVTPWLVQRLQKIQDQILVLIHNHEVLHQKMREHPQESLSIQRKICAVEKFLIQFNEEQQPILTQVEQEIKEKGLVVAPLRPELVPKGEPVDDDEEEEQKSEEVIRAQAKKVGGGGRKKQASKRKLGGSQRPTRTPTPDKDELDETPEDKRRRLEEEANCGQPLIGEGQYKGHLDLVEKKTYVTPVRPVKECDLPDFPFKLRNIVYKPGKVYNEKINFMWHLDLLGEVDVKRLNEYRETIREKTVEYRNLTYVPDMNEKKTRFGYSWLSTDQMNSPPLLRNRRRIGGLDAANIQQLMLDKPRTRRKKVLESRSNSNSRASTPVPTTAVTRSTRNNNKVALVDAEEEMDDDEEEEDEEEERLVDTIEAGNDDDDPDVDDEVDEDSASKASSNNEDNVRTDDEVPNLSRRPAELNLVSDALVMERDEAEEETVTPLAPSEAAQQCVMVDDAVVAALPPQEEEDDDDQDEKIEEQQQQQKEDPEDELRPRRNSRGTQKEVRLGKIVKLKKIQEQQLAKTMDKLQSLNQELDSKGGKFTVATRKERSRRNLVEQERSGLESKVKELKLKISQSTKDIEKLQNQDL